MPETNLPASNISKPAAPKTPKIVRLPKSRPRRHHLRNYSFWSKPASHRSFVLQANLLNKFFVGALLILAIIGAFTVTKAAFTKFGAEFSGFSAADFESRLLVNAPAANVPSQPVQPSCTNQCTETFCKDGKILVECKDTNGDGCTEIAETPCGYSCENKQCNNVQDIFTLKTGDSIIQFLPTKIKLATVNPDKTVTLEVDYDIYVLAQGDVQVIKGLSITVTSIGIDSVTLKVRQV